MSCCEPPFETVTLIVPLTEALFAGAVTGERKLGPDLENQRGSRLLS